MSSVLIMMSAEYPEHCKILSQINYSASETKHVKAGVKVSVGIG